jgi:hypothetical protein
LHQFVIREALEALGFFSFVTIAGVVALDEIDSIVVFQWISFKREVFVRTCIGRLVEA